MATNQKVNKLKEKAFSPSLDSKKRSHPESNKEVNEAGLGKVAYREAVGFDESAETTGKVSEILQEDSEQKGDGITAGSGASSKKILDPAQIRANLLKKIPSEKTMKSQIEREIKAEISYLHRKAMKMFASPGSMNFFEMSNLMKKIRELKGILSTIAKAALDALKTLWLRFVHGVL